MKKNYIIKAAAYAGLIGAAALIVAVLIWDSSKKAKMHYFPQNSQIEIKLEDVDQSHEGLEHLLIIDGEKYKIQQNFGEPMLVKLIRYNKTDDDVLLYPLLDPRNPISPIYD